MYVTNNVPRDFIDGYELTPAERDQFDYLDWSAIDEGTVSATFFRYRGDLYSLDQFMRLGHTDGWDAGMATSAFSGIVIRLVEDDYDARVVVGTWIND
jgi:hypothetical protein